MGFDKDGAIRDTISLPVIRSFYFDKEQEEAGVRLLQEAVKALSDGADRIYAFFHYFGMSCYARHGKLFEGFAHVHKLLEKSGFDIEHENVFYSAVLKDEKCTAVKLKWHDMTPGRQQYCDFTLDNAVVGGCEVHFLEQKDIAYLRWIFTQENKCGQGIGSKSMSALRADLFQRGIVRFDTDTALTNQVAQHFYEKNHFVREGLTRSYYKTVS